MSYCEIRALCEKSGSLCERNFILADKTSMKIGGECDVFAVPADEQTLVELVRICKRNGIPYFILGKGSNVLINRYGGVVISTARLNAISVDGGHITAGAGAPLSAVCRAALDNSLSGMESLYGIPGSVGGALFMNAGAFGGEMKDVVVSARCIGEDGKVFDIPARDMDLSYRHSVFCDKKLCVLSAELLLQKGDKNAIGERMEELMNRRREKQPLEFPSCGSTFKRPQNGFAAALIEECGLKGFTVGGAQVSEKHSGFVINKGGATFEDVTALVEHIKKTVKEKKGVELECEMLILGQ